VRSALVHLLILAAMLCAGLAAPVAAHAHGASAAIEHIEMHAATDHSHHHDVQANDPQDDGGNDGVAPHHHHCPAGMTALAPGMSGRLLPCRDTPHPAPSARLDSRALAPLTEPPAA
jgi:hypothetical protein